MIQPPTSLAQTPGWQRFSAAALRAFHTYANWLVGISWRRFLVLSLLLVIVAAIVEELPPFRWKTTELVTETTAPRVPAPPTAPRPSVRIDKPKPGTSMPEGVDISIDEHGVHITPRGRAASDILPRGRAASDILPSGRAASAGASASAASAADAGDAETSPSSTAADGLPEVTVKLPPGADTAEVKEAVNDAKQEIAQAIRDATEAAREAATDAAEAEAAAPHFRTRTVHVADFLSDLAFLWVIGSAIIKISYKGRLKAEAVAAQATEVAEAESLKRQVVEARMAAMQAQVEPHFLFNTLASIDHLIETDPPRASKMQRNLISLLRASMPTMREASAGGLRDLGQELSVIKPYLEILKVRMEERLQTTLDIPEGLQSAEFPPMMIQGLVENAIKHGLEPKAEGGHLLVKAEILHGRLAVTVADTGLGFGKAATAGTGVGLANIRERLQLLYGAKASVTVAENQPSGTVVTITVPYAARPGARSA